MNKNNLLILIVILSAFSFLVYLTLRGDDDKRKYNWETTFTNSDKQPYDFGIIQKLVTHQTKGKFEVINSQLKEKLQALRSNDTFNYLFIGRYCFYTKAEIDALLEFTANGGKLMLIAEQFPDTLLSVLQENGKPFKIDELNLNNVNVRLNNQNSPIQNHRYKYRYFKGEGERSVNWNYISEEGQLDYYYGTTSSRYLRLGEVNDKLNFAKFRLGNGYIYLHTNPILFTNYFIASDTGFAYASKVFSELETDNIIYDLGAREYKEDATRIIRQSQSPLSYILKQPALKWAWYLLIIATVSFFLFRAKREQRIIAVLEQKRNTSLHFVETISGLYFNYNDHKKMTIIKMNLFSGFIRQKLGIPTNDITPEVLQQISTKAKVPLHDTEIIFYYYKNLIENEKDVDADDLVNLNQYIETFYKYYNAKKT